MPRPNGSITIDTCLPSRYAAPGCGRAAPTPTRRRSGCRSSRHPCPMPRPGRLAMKLAFRAAPTADARRALEALRHRYGTHEPADADVIVPLGGDGYMLKPLPPFLDLAKPIYGMNLGTVGFLLNGYDI